MSIKKCKPLGSAIKEFVFGTKEVALPPTPPEAVPVPTPTASLITETPPTPFALLPTVTPPQPEASPPEPVPIQSKEFRFMSKLQAPHKELTVRFTGDMSESLHRKLSMLAAKTGRKNIFADAARGWVEGSGCVGRSFEPPLK